LGENISSQCFNCP